MNSLYEWFRKWFRFALFMVPIYMVIWIGLDLFLGTPIEFFKVFINAVIFSILFELFDSLIRKWQKK